MATGEYPEGFYRTESAPSSAVSAHVCCTFRKSPFCKSNVGSTWDYKDQIQVPALQFFSQATFKVTLCHWIWVSFKMHADSKESPKHTSLHSKKVLLQVQVPRSNYSCQIAVCFSDFFLNIVLTIDRLLCISLVLLRSGILTWTGFVVSLIIYMKVLCNSWNAV